MKMGGPILMLLFGDNAFLYGSLLRKKVCDLLLRQWALGVREEEPKAIESECFLCGTCFAEAYLLSDCFYHSAFRYFPM